MSRKQYGPRIMRLCALCGQPEAEHDEVVCANTRKPGFVKRGLPRKPYRPDFEDSPLPGAEDWDTSGTLFDWPAP